MPPIPDLTLEFDPSVWKGYGHWVRVWGRGLCLGLAGSRDGWDGYMGEVWVGWVCLGLRPMVVNDKPTGRQESRVIM
jgi:hypothetical protein